MAIRIAQGNGKGGLVLLVRLKHSGRGLKRRVAGTNRRSEHPGLPELGYVMLHIPDTAGIIRRVVDTAVRSGRFSHIEDMRIRIYIYTGTILRVDNKQDI